MGVFGALGRAIKAPIKPIQKAVNKAPGMGAMNKAVGKVPGMNALGGAMGIGPSPQAAQGGLGAKMAMIAQKAQQPPPQQMAPPREYEMQAPPPDMNAELGGEPQMPQVQEMQQQAPPPPPPMPQQGGFMSNLAQKYGQMRPGMGQPQPRSSMGRSVGSAMRRMF